MKNPIHAALIALLAVALIAAGLVEIRWHVIERFIGAYMDARNDSRERLERFVDQESRTNQALEHANRLIEQRSQVALDSVEEPARRDNRFGSPSDVVRLERGHKLIMTRDRFLEIPRWFTGFGHPPAAQPGAVSGGVPHVPSASRADLPPASRADLPSSSGADLTSASRADLPSSSGEDSLSRSPSAFDPDFLEDWTHTVVIRPGWIRKGEAYMVDDDNYILHRMPISVEQFEIIDAYAAASEGQMHEGMEHVFGPGEFFETLRSLDMEMRDEIIDPLRFRDLETTAQRVGVSEGQRIIQIERLIDGRIDVVTIPVSADLFVELYVALGAL